MKSIQYQPSLWPNLQKQLGLSAFPPVQLQRVRNILREVQEKGDEALRAFTLRFDGVKIKSFAVTPSEVRAARKYLTPGIGRVFREVERNIQNFHCLRLPKSWRQGRGDGLWWGERFTPIEKVGIYIPGGRSPLVSTVFMTVIPARLAGVPRIVLVSPPSQDGSIHPLILAAAESLGIKEIYKIGGAQAIAALAFGTKSIPRVDKIAGPGNIYVALAKKEVFGFVDVDLLAGPSEVAVLADSTARPDYIAADLLAQAEHGAGGVSILVTTSGKLIEAVGRGIDELLPRLFRRSALRRTIEQGVFLIRVRSLRTGIELINRIAPEHLEVMTRKPGGVVSEIKNSGAIFIGDYSPVAAGDYVAGPSHVLPTRGSSRFFSPLSVLDFLKRSSLICYNRRSLEKDLPLLQALAEIEGLEAHSLSARIRLRKKSNRPRTP